MAKGDKSRDKEHSNKRRDMGAQYAFYIRHKLGLIVLNHQQTTLITCSKLPQINWNLTALSLESAGGPRIDSIKHGTYDKTLLYLVSRQLLNDRPLLQVWHPNYNIIPQDNALLVSPVSCSLVKYDKPYKL